MVILVLNAVAYPMVCSATSGGVTVGIFPNVSNAVGQNGRPLFQKGMSYTAYAPEEFSTPASDESLELLAETNTEWVSICLSWVQSNTTSHDIHPDPVNTPSNESVEYAIAKVHSLGMKVMLKPMVDTLEPETVQGYYTVWRGEIEPSAEWFASYSNFINFFAELAEENNVELFCVGCEFKATIDEKEQWENVIAGVRERYSGPLTYAADWTSYHDIEWWGSLDYVGIDAYFPLSLITNNPSLEDLKSAWTNHANEIEKWLVTVNKPVIFTEIGYRSGDGTSRAPANYWSNMAVDLQEQVDCYEAAFQTLWDRCWFYGFYWWSWFTYPDMGGVNDSSHTPQNKPAQDVVTEWYSKHIQIAIVDKAVVSANRTSINKAETVAFHACWEHNGSDVVDAKIYVNETEYVTNSTGWISFSVEYDSVGKRTWVVTDLEHPEASSYKIAVEAPHIIWDKVLVNVDVDSATLGVSKVRVRVSHAYDGTAATGATVVANGQLCEETEDGVYVTELSSWRPYEQVAVQVETESYPTESSLTTTIHSVNTIIYSLISIATITVLIFVLKRRRKNSN